MAMTGRKVLLICVVSFGVVIAVNVTMAVMAVGTFPGLEVKNSYVASQSFDANRASQEALGWVVDADIDDGILSIAFTTEDGTPVSVANLDATVGRATHVKSDFVPDFSYYRGTFTAPVELEPGNWDIRMVAEAPDGTLFRKRLELHLLE